MGLGANVGKGERVGMRERSRRKEERKRKKDETRSNEQELHSLCIRPRKGKVRKYSRWEENTEPDEMRIMKTVKMLMKYKTGNLKRWKGVFSSKFFLLTHP